MTSSRSDRSSRFLGRSLEQESCIGHMLPVVKQLSTVLQMNSVHHGDSTVTAQDSEQLDGHCLVPVRFWTYDEPLPCPHGQLSLVSQSFFRIAFIRAVTSSDFQHIQWSRILRSVYSEVPEAHETTCVESLQTSGMNTLHTWALEHSVRRFGILTSVIFQLLTTLLSFCLPGAVSTDGDDHVPMHR